MPETPNGLPYPASTATPDVPRDFLALATELDPWAAVLRASVCQSGATTSIPSGTETAVAMNTETYDVGGFWDAATPSRLVVPVDGVYLLNGTLGFASAGASPAGYREALIYKNGAAIARDRDTPVPSASSVLTLTVESPCSAGDYFELYGFHNQGAAVATVSGTSWTRLQIRYVGPL